MPEVVYSYLSKQLRDHGLSFVLLALAVWYFQGQNIELAREIKACNESIIEIYRTDRQRNMEVVSNNTKALEQNTKVIEHLKSIER